MVSIVSRVSRVRVKVSVIGLGFTISLATVCPWIYRHFSTMLYLNTVVRILIVTTLALIGLRLS